MAARWLPNVEDFFERFLRLIETSENNFHSATYDNSEFLFRRLDVHERTLSTLLTRIEQSYDGVPQVHDPTRDLGTLLSHTSNLRSHYESRFFLSLERDSRDLKQPRRRAEWTPTGSARANSTTTAHVNAVVHISFRT